MSRAQKLEIWMLTTRPMTRDEEALMARCLSLTDREVAVMALVADGLYTKVIADRLGLSYFTVADHLKSVFKKLGVRDRTLAAVLLVRHGVLS